LRCKFGGQKPKLKTGCNRKTKRVGKLKIKHYEKFQVFGNFSSWRSHVKQLRRCKKSTHRFLYTSMKNPHSVTSNAGASKVGTSEAMSILGIVATGDASIDAAAKAAGITKIHHVDEEATAILGIIAKYKIYVYGE
jgi:hypothetical protein